jgi:hypothetical protein
MPLVPTDVTFRGLDPDPLLEGEAHQLVRWLEHALGDAIGCRVVLSLSQPRRHAGQTAEARVETVLTGLNEPMVVERLSSVGRVWDDFGVHVPTAESTEAVHRQMRIALADAFTTVRRRLQESVDLRRDARRSA